MAWDDSANAGFSTGEPWLPLHPDWQTRNLAAQRGEPGSMWQLHHDLLALRRQHPALSVGDWHAVEASGDLLAYERRHCDQRMLIVLNLGDRPQGFSIPEWAEGFTPRLSTRGGTPDPALLRPSEGLILA